MKEWNESASGFENSSTLNSTVCTLKSAWEYRLVRFYYSSKRPFLPYYRIKSTRANNIRWNFAMSVEKEMETDALAMIMCVGRERWDCSTLGNELRNAFSRWQQPSFNLRLSWSSSSLRYTCDEKEWVWLKNANFELWHRVQAVRDIR